MLTEELDERAFLCAVQINCDGCRLFGICRVDLYFLGVFGGVESLLLQGSTSVWQHVVIGGQLSCLILSLHPE